MNKSFYIFSDEDYEIKIEEGIFLFEEIATGNKYIIDEETKEDILETIAILGEKYGFEIIPKIENGIEVIKIKI